MSAAADRSHILERLTEILGPPIHRIFGDGHDSYKWPTKCLRHSWYLMGASVSYDRISVPEGGDYWSDEELMVLEFEEVLAPGFLTPENLQRIEAECAIMESE